MSILTRSSAGVAAGVLLWFSAACSSPGSSPNATAGGSRAGGRGAGAAVPVSTARAERKPIPVTLPAVGTVESISTVQIRAQVTGQISAIHFAEGQDVRKGQPMFTLDPRPFQAALQQAEAVLGRDTATWSNAQAQQARSDSLFKRGLIAREQYDSQRASVEALAGTVAADKAAIETARLNLQYTSIAAPLDGRTGSLGVHVGDLVRSSDSTPLVMINQLSPVYVTFSVPARYLADVRRYQAARPLSVTATPPRGTQESGAAPSASAVPARGAVSFIDNTVDTTTATIRLKATFTNADRQLWPGAFVEVTLLLTTEADALVVPAMAVQASQDGQFVYVVKPDRTVDMRKVVVARQQGDFAVIGSGVAAGDVVVTDGQLRLTPGASVRERGEAPAGGQGGGQVGDAGGRRGDR